MTGLRIVALAGVGCALISASCELFAPSDSDLRGPVTYHDVTSPAFWSTFDTTTAFPLAHDFAGGAFDGRYVYLSPSTSGVVTRYDTQSSFTDKGSWSVFNATTLDPKASRYAGAVFDGRYVYFVPTFDYGGLGSAGHLVRFDTQGSFGPGPAWSIFDTSGIGAYGFMGATFDGRYLYFAPFHENNDSDGIVARYDTRADLEAGTSWTTFDMGPISPNGGAGGFFGAVFDGRYVYFLQNENAGAALGKLVAQYDTQADFGTKTSWAFLDLSNLNPRVAGLFGGAFDGQFLYAVPGETDLISGGDAGISSILGRYDTRGSFKASWTTFDTTTVDPNLWGFAGGAFDGRYVYLVPHANGLPDGLLARLDTHAVDYSAAGSWSKFDIATVNQNARGFTGAVFDGRFLYFVPSSGGVVARFDARTPPAMPGLPAFHGSFF